MSSKGQISVTKKTDFRTGIFFLVVSFIVIVQAGKMPNKMPGIDFGPGILPFWLGVILCVLSFCLIIQSFSVKSSNHSTIRRRDATEVGILFGVLVLYYILMQVLGYALSTFLLVTYLSKKLGKYALWKCALLGAITGSLIFYVFKIALALPLPVGIFGF